MALGGWGKLRAEEDVSPAFILGVLFFFAVVVFAYTPGYGPFPLPNSDIFAIVQPSIPLSLSFFLFPRHSTQQQVSSFERAN
uniref:Uncharacterized protein n=1 Tax=Anopheles darlingi TaxID=43151 RepID=A0A2M4DG51_ANODA